MSPNLDADKLLSILDFLPLAITQAAAFIKENNISVSKYMGILQKSDLDQVDILSKNLHDSKRNGDTPDSVILTWKISFEQIKKRNPRAAHILSLMSVLDRQGIPQSLLQRKNEREPEFLTAIGTLEAFSLIKVERGRESFAMHRLVQLSTRGYPAHHGQFRGTYPKGYSGPDWTRGTSPLGRFPLFQIFCNTINLYPIYPTIPFDPYIFDRYAIITNYGMVLSIISGYLQVYDFSNCAQQSGGDLKIFA